jgi:hypothetical protein
MEQVLLVSGLVGIPTTAPTSCRIGNSNGAQALVKGLTPCKTAKRVVVAAAVKEEENDKEEEEDEEVRRRRKKI